MSELLDTEIEALTALWLRSKRDISGGCDDSKGCEQKCGCDCCECDCSQCWRCVCKPKHQPENKTCPCEDCLNAIKARIKQLEGLKKPPTPAKGPLIDLLGTLQHPNPDRASASQAD